MKKLVTIALVVVLLIGVLSFTGCKKEIDYAKDLTPSDGLEFHHISEIGTSFNFSFADYVEGDDYYVVTGIGTCKDSIIIVPSEYNGKPVKAVADRAFFRSDSVTGFIFPNSVECVGQLSIGGAGLEVLKGNGIRCYGDGATGGCKIKDVVLSQKTEYISQWAFFFSPDTETIWIPKTLKAFGPQPFMDSGYKKIYYEGSEEDWNKITYDAGEKDFDIPIEFNVKYPGIQ